MSTKTEINTLWQQFRAAINSAYSEADKAHDVDGQCLRDYAENISWHDDLAKLVDSEALNERQHRRNGNSPKDFSVDVAVKMLLMTNAAHGATKADMPKATAFLVLRRTAVEAETLGFLARKHLTQEWQDAVNAFDYAKLMRADGGTR